MPDAPLSAPLPEPLRPGAQRAAALLLGLGPEVAGPIFRLLAESELRLLAQGGRQLRRGSPNAVPDALRIFVESMDRIGGEAAAGDEMLREFASKAIGGDLIRRAFDGLVPPPPPDEVLGPIANADPESLAMILAREQPQTIALVLCSLGSQRAAEVLEKLPEISRTEIVRRMATIESVAPEVLREVGQALAIELRAVVAGGMRRVDGKSAAVEVLRRSPSSRQTAVVAEIERNDAKLAQELRAQLFTFDDLRHLGDRDIQTIIKDVDLSRLTLALKGAAPEMREKFLRNMSSRGAQMLEEDLAAMGAVKLATVEKAQGEVAKVALTLAEQERITLIGPADKML